MSRPVLVDLGDRIHFLRPDAGMAFSAMAFAYGLDTGRDLTVNHAYRSWWHQLGVKMVLPKKAAWPWESAHVRGVAVDLNVGGFWSDIYLWLHENAGQFGWTQPEWAQECGWNPEPWHWEYVGGKS